MKNKSLLPILVLAALTLGACNLGGQSQASIESEQPQQSQSGSEGQPTTSEDTTQYGVAIANKAALQEQWFVGDNRDVDVTLTPATNPLLELGKNLSVASSNTEVVAVTGLGLSAVGAGTATITVTYHDQTDSVEVTITSNDPKARYGTAHSGTAEDPFTNEDAILVAEAAGATATSEKYYVRGVVDSFRDAPSSYGNVSFYFTPATENGKKFLAYRVKLGEAGTNVTADDIWIGGTATIFCNMYNYNGNTPENSAGWLVSCTGEKQQIQNHEVNVAQAIEACKALGANGASDGKDTYDVTGYIVYVDGNNYYLSDTKGATSKNSATQFQVYGYSGENKDQCTVDAKIKVSCTIKYYKSSTSDSFAYETSVITGIEILEAGQEPDLKITGAEGLKALTAGTYKVGFLQETINQNCFFTGSINSSKYGATSAKWSDAADVVVEGDATNGFKMKVGDKYLNPIIVDTTKVRLGLEDAAVTYQWNDVANTLTTQMTVDGKAGTYYLGTYSTYNTISVSAISNLIADGKVKAGQFPLQFYAKAEMNADPTGIQFIGQEASALVGVPCELSFRINPYNVDLSKLVWETSDNTVATVAAGVVTGIKAGKVTITAKFGTEIIDTIEVNVAEVNLGTAEAPLTVEEALAAANTLKIANGAFSPKKAYVKGVIANRSDTFVNGDFFGKWDLKTGDKKIYVVNSKPVAAIKGNIFENDEVIMSGFLSKDATEGIEFLKSGDDYPVVESLVQRGTSTVTVGDHANASVIEVSKESGENLSTFTFKVTANEGYGVDWVKVNGQEVEAADGVYTGTIKGNTVITVKASEKLLPPAAPVTVSKTIAQLVPENTANGTQIDSFELDKYVTVSVNPDGNNGKVYGTGTEWRMYQANNPKVAVTVPEGCVITSVTFTYTVGNTGTFKYGDTVLTSGTAVAIDNLAKAEFTVGNSGSATNGQVKITGISVTYGPASAAQPEIAQPTGAFRGLAKSKAGTFLPVDMILAADGVTLYANGDAVAVTSHEWDKTQGQITIVTDAAGYGTIVAKLDVDNNVFTITSINGTAALASLDLTYAVKLSGNCQFLDCEQDVTGLSNIFQRRKKEYSADNSKPWEAANTDRIFSDDNGKVGKGLRVQGWKDGMVSIALKNDLNNGQGIQGDKVKDAGVWIYNPNTDDSVVVKVSFYIFKEANYGGAAQLKEVTLEKGWNYFQCGISLSSSEKLYNFMFYLGYRNVNLVYDNFCLYM